MPLDVGIFALSPSQRPRAQALAGRWGLPLIDDAQQARFVLRVGEDGLELGERGSGTKPIRCEFVEGKAGYRRRLGGGRKQLLVRAVGVKGGRAPRVLDATAGLGQDAFVLATYGCRVTLVERSPLIAALLEDGLRRAHSDEDAAPIVQRMRLEHADARELLIGRDASAQPEVIYLDPMYPHRNKAALPKKEMRFFRELLGDDHDAGALLEVALMRARQRVVVKRPKNASPLADTPPSTTLESKTTRFDIYLVRRATSRQGVE